MLLNWVEADAVDGKISASRSLFKSHLRISIDQKSLMTFTGFTLTSGKADIILSMLGDQLEHSKAFTNSKYLAELGQHSFKFIRFETVDLQIQIFRKPLSKQIVPDAPSNKDRLSTLLMNGVG